MQVKEAVAACLTQADGQFCSGAVLAKKLGVSRNAVWKAVQALQNEGFPIEARKKTGYRITQEADLLTADSVRPYLHTRVLGHPLYVHPELDSTNARCRDLARRGAAHGTVVAANSQTAGRGRQGRLFCSPPGSGLYFSVLLKQAVALQEAPMLTACAAVAAARAIDALYSTHTHIKWVNDLYLDGKKCCGILTEGEVSLESGKLECAIIGIGINVRNTQSCLPPELHPIVTSLEEAIPGCQVRRSELLAAVLYELEVLLPELSFRRFLPEYRDRSCLIGKTAEITMENGARKKVAVVEIADDCGLVVRDSYGNVETLHAGEVHIGSGNLSDS